MKPVRLSAAATIALPRWGLIALCLLYILPGIVRRDPWKVDDASGFGIMWTMAHGALSDWLSPNIVGLAMPSEAPLAYWIGAILIRLAHRRRAGGQIIDFGFFRDWHPSSLAHRLRTG
jgi:4-amino-4-deoxy-L-arabinose transferase-like glycosyltransferase